VIFQLTDRKADSRLNPSVCATLKVIIGMDTLGPDLTPTRIVGPNVGYSAICWLCIWACLAFGLKWTGRIAYISAGLPIILLFVFLIKACTLEGASEGIEAYIGVWDMSVLTERPEVWSVALSQVFFSLSITFGTMTAYGSGCPRGEPSFVNALFIGCCDSMFSFISGFAVFAAVGHLAWQNGVPVDEISYGSFSLLFGTWPVVFGSLPGGQHWVRLLFVNFFLLGIDSAFSILEAPLTVFYDRAGMRKYPKWMVSGLFSLLAFLLSLMYCTDAGLIFLDTIDFYINFVLIFIGFFETFGAGWIYNLEEQVTKLGPEIVLMYMFTTFGSIIVACGLWFGLEGDNAVWGGFLGLFLCYFAGLGVTFMLLAKKMAQEPEWTWKTILYELCLKNVMDLRQELSAVVGYMPWAWAFAMKNLIPQILLILFTNLAQSENTAGQSLFGHYGEYVAWPFQVLGILCVVFAAFLILVGLAMPVVYEPYDIPYRKALEARTDPTEPTSTKKEEISEGQEEEVMAEVTV
jgi:solute carrier family 6 (neurotransmitter transporter, GABA) member 1